MQGERAAIGFGSHDRLEVDEQPGAPQERRANTTRDASDAEELDFLPFDQATPFPPFQRSFLASAAAFSFDIRFPARPVNFYSAVVSAHWDLAMASRYKDKDVGTVLLSFGGQWVSWAHTTVAYSEFSVCSSVLLAD